VRLTQIVAALRVEEPGVHAVEVSDDWTQGRTLFGGLQAALLVRAMRSQLPAADAQLALRSLQVTFVAPVFAGRLRIRSRLLRTGKSAVHCEARIESADGHTECLAVAVFGRSRPSALSFAPSRPVVARDPQASRQIEWLAGASPLFTRYLEQRWSAGGFPFTAAAEPHTQIHLRYRDEPCIDESLVIALADSIPSPAISTLREPAMASSLGWTLEMLRDTWPTDGTRFWLMDAVADAAADGYVSQSATLWSDDDRPVALSRQSAVVFG
jgi:acyl-coenzyme A thioesterase PaaI-like protein